MQVLIIPLAFIVFFIGGVGVGQYARGLTIQIVDCVSKPPIK